ncbi:MAG: methyltransferase domain-containing protein [Dehalococcoidales bacterium]|nr:methyltransferase domain-containing protein [Dehalococcoidales bacterium]
MKQLNLGCGDDIKKGWTNLDIASLPGVDIVHNIENLPLPFGDEEFDYILCKDILEHVDYIPILKDIHRILKMTGIVEIQVPHFTSMYSFGDPTHKKYFSATTFQFFILNTENKRSYYFDFHFSRIVQTKIAFERGFLFFNYFVQPIVNFNNRTRHLFEATFLSRLFPAATLIVKLEK